MDVQSPHSRASEAADQFHGSETRRWRHYEAPDPALLGRLSSVEQACLALVTLIAVGVLAAWLIPPFGSLLMPGWALMKANTALLLLLSAISFFLSQPRRTQAAVNASRVVGLLVLATAAAGLVEYLFTVSLSIDTWLATDSDSAHPGRMSPQTAVALTLLSVVLIFVRTKKKPAAYVVDAFVFLLCPLVMVVVSGYAFGVIHLFGISAATRTSPHTLLCLILLTLVAFMRRTENGFLSVLAGRGIGSRIARVAAPLTLAVPFLLEAGRFGVVRLGLMGAEYSTALVTASAGVMGFALVLMLAWRIDSLEEKIRILSLRDDLTGLYNRRGFFLFAEREYRLANRSQVPFSVLFIDLDGLKKVNDQHGHEVGSTFLQETAGLLKKTFRDSDILARIGGDEFVVAGTLGASGVTRAAQRLEDAAAERNADGGNAYLLGFSIGYAVSDTQQTETLEELLNRADAEMYRRKRNKGTGR